LKMKYEPYYQDEIINIIEIFEEKLKPTEHTEDLENTQTLCYCFLVSINQMIRGAFGALSCKSMLGFNIIFRAITEHMVDLYLIALSDDIFMNRRFVNYYKYKRYNMKKDTDYLKREEPKIIEEYRNFIKQDYPDFIVYKEDKNGNSIENWAEIDKNVKKIYNLNWINMQFHLRVDKIEKLIENKRKLSNHQNHFFQLKDLLEKLWFYHSMIIHPSTYSTIPHYDPKETEFQLRYNYPNEELKERESFYLLNALICAIDAFTYSIEDNEKKSLLDELGDLLISNEKIKDFMITAYHATHISHK